MTLDLATLLFVATAMSAVATAFLLVAWAQDRTQRALLWMASAPMMAATGAILRAELPLGAALVLSNVAVLLAAGAFWAACRCLRRLEVTVEPFLWPTIVWVAALTWPEFAQSLDARIALISLLCAILIGQAFYELQALRSGDETLIALRSLLIVSSVQATIMLARSIIAVLALAGVLENSKIPIHDFAMLTLGSMLCVLVLSLAMVVLVKDRGARDARLDADTDHLTGLPNRRRFEQDLDLFLDRAATAGRPLSLLMIDIDGFKAYNDRNGHLSGDLCLKHIGSAIALELGGAGRGAGTALAYRIGGEEFVVLLPDRDEADAFSQAEMLREAIRRLGIRREPGGAAVVTISLGCACVVPTSREVATDLVEAADQALYRAKGSGRDRTCVASQEPEAAETLLPQSLQFRVVT